MEADEYYEGASSPCAERGDAQSPPHYNLEPEKQLILKYESLPQLWDTSDIRYSNRFERYRALGQLLPIYQKVKPYATLEDIKKKINSLRSNFRRELKKYIASEKSGGNDGYYPKVWYFPYLSFLRKLEHPDYQSESTLKVEETGSNQNASKERTLIISKPTSILQSLCTGSKQQAPSPQPKFKKRIFREKTRNGPYHIQPFQHRHQCEKISNPMALEWSDTLTRLDPLQRLYAKKAINDVLFEAELGNLHKHSVQINESNSYYMRTPPGGSDDMTTENPPTRPSTQQSDPISIKNNDSASEVDYKIPLTFLHCNLESEGQTQETEFGD